MEPLQEIKDILAPFAEATAMTEVIDSTEINEDVPFVVETDASNVALSATLNQNNKPVAFFSRSLNKSEVKQSSVEKEAAAIVEAIRKWSHFLAGHHFELITDQRPVAFMYDHKTHGKLNYTKVLRWRIELSQYDYEIVYRAGKCNVASDALSRAYCATIHNDFLLDMHRSLCHPGVSRMYHHVKTKNLPYSLEEVRKMTSACTTCAEIKPQFYKPVETHIVKVTQPMERLCVDFKGPNAYCLSFTTGYCLSFTTVYAFWFVCFCTF